MERETVFFLSIALVAWIYGGTLGLLFYRDEFARGRKIPWLRGIGMFCMGWANYVYWNIGFDWL